MLKKRFSFNTTILKLFLSIVLISVIVSLLLFFITFLGISTIASDRGNAYPNTPARVLSEISGHLLINGRPGDAYQDTQEDTSSGAVPQVTMQDDFTLSNKYWCILIDRNGDIIWSVRQPSDIPSHYSLNDIARMTRWFLNDYPVYVRTENYGLLVLGREKNTVGKYSVEYSMDWFASLPRRFLIVFLFNFLMASLFCCLLGSFLYKKIKLLTIALSNLKQEKVVSLPARGIFKELFLNINKTSETLARKNALLSTRDKARSNWISGISHDIRTPLSMVVGYGQQLAENDELSDENRKYASIIAAQGLKIKKLIEDLNLISSLEYDMQPSNKRPVQLCALLRSVVSDILNQELPDCYEFHLALHCEQAVILADEALLTRAFYNLLQNSIIHNEQGCQIRISDCLHKDSVSVTIADNGRGCPEKVLQNLNVLPNTAHGLGLPMARKIIQAHGGHFHAENRDGFVVSMELPLVDVP